MSIVHCALTMLIDNFQYFSVINMCMVEANKVSMVSQLNSEARVQAALSIERLHTL